jgi:hypothetical protein
MIHIGHPFLCLVFKSIRHARRNLGVPKKEQKPTKTSGRFPDLKIFSGTNVLMIRDSV